MKFLNFFSVKKSQRAEKQLQARKTFFYIDGEGEEGTLWQMKIFRRNVAQYQKTGTNVEIVSLRKSLQVPKNPKGDPLNLISLPVLKLLERFAYTLMFPVTFIMIFLQSYCNFHAKIFSCRISFLSNCLKDLQNFGGNFKPRKFAGFIRQQLKFWKQIISYDFYC